MNDRQTSCEDARELRVISGYDVVVVGGGIAGIAAAVSARRHGQTVLLIEKLFGLGGLATLGNVLHFLPLCDGKGTQVIGGICEELLLLADAGCKAQWCRGERPRYDSCFNPSEYLLQLEAFVCAEGVDIFYDTRVCGSMTREGSITHVVIENKDGRQAVAAAAFVDCSGDADLCAFACTPTASLDSNVLCGWHYLQIDGKMELQTFSEHFDCEMTRAGSAPPFFAGDKAEDVTQMVLQSRRAISDRIAAMRAESPNKEIEPFEIPSIPCFRATRRLDSDHVLCMDDCGKWFDDAVAMTGDWRCKGPVYAIPLRSVRSPHHNNLFVAGRCISARDGAWDITRSIPTCGVTGQAAGTAAGVMASGGSVAIAELQARLRSDGQLIDQTLLPRDGGCRIHKTEKEV